MDPIVTPDASSAPAPAAGAPKAGAVPPAGGAKPEGSAPAPVQKYKLGEEEFDEPTLKQLIEKGRGADKRFQEAAARRKEVDAVVAQLKANPAKVLLNKALGHNPAKVMAEIIREASEAGHDVKEIREELSKIMYQWIQDEQMDPKEKEIRDLRKQLEKNEMTKKQEADAKQKAMEAELTAKAQETFTKDIVGALQESGLPKTTFTVKRMAYHLDQAYKLKAEYEAAGVRVRNPKASDVVQFVRKDYDDAFKELYGSSDAEQLYKLIGEENMKKVREYDVNKLRGQQPGAGAPAKPGVPSQSAPLAKGKNFLAQREAEIREKERREREGK